MNLVPLPFAAGLVLETPPLQSQYWWQYIETFLQDAGAFALLGLWVWILSTIVRGFVPASGPRRGLPLLLLLVAVVALTLYAIGGIGGMLAAPDASPDASGGPPVPSPRAKWFGWIMTAGGFAALLGVFVPFLMDSSRLRLRRIWALARHSFIESVRRRVLWVFLIFLLLFLFPPKWFVLIKPEDEVRTNVELVHFGATAVLLLAAAAMTSFSIPTDIRNQTIHTIVTKPVEKFEIVMGRFLGYLGLTTAVMFAVFAVALLMLIASRVDPEAQRESMRARKPVYGELGFAGPSKDFQGESVGREWEYRRYIPGGVANPHRAIWYFTDRTMERSLATLPVVSCEFAFDIFRTTKGEENKSVECTFFVLAHQANSDLEVARKYQERIKGLSPKASPTGTDAEKRDWDEISKIAGELGYYEYRSKPVADYHTDAIPIPSSLFKKSYESNPPDIEIPNVGKVPGARVLVSVRCDSRTQFLGVAKPDLFLLAAEDSFYVNFFKGAAGLWFRLLIVIGVAVTCSTYLNGVVSFLVTIVLTILGFLKPFVIFMTMQLSGDMPNPGPADSLRKLVSNESLGTAGDVTNPTHQVSVAADEVFRWGLRRVISIIPDLWRYSWQDYVASGFNVPIEDLGWNFLSVCGYLSVWAVLGHYLMKWREIATW